MRYWIGLQKEALLAERVFLPLNLWRFSMSVPALCNSELREIASDRGASKQLERLKDLLREMFQLDRGDLDFEPYCIMKTQD